MVRSVSLMIAVSPTTTFVTRLVGATYSFVPCSRVIITAIWNPSFALAILLFVGR
jgi:hypothetical protein